MDIGSNAVTILDEPLVFVDVETTGVSAVRGQVIEVAAIRYENGEVTDTFTSFVNPSRPIPYNITRITGITDADVAQAPPFREIADELLAIMDGAIFVAHNVRFDYSFLHQEFRRIGRVFRPKMLCTVRLSRALYPNLPRHRLADLINYHGFDFTHRHRAYDDAAVLVQFWQKALAEHSPDALLAAISRQIKTPSLPRHIDPSIIAGLPKTTGVYIFRDEAGVPIYIGKSIDIKKRVLSHFTRDREESKEFKITQAIRSIDYEITNGELAALLRESHLVKQYKPMYNRKLRRVRQLSVLERITDQNGYHHIQRRELAPEAIPDASNLLAMFERRSGAKRSLETAVDTFDLCPKLCGLEKTNGACFRYQLGRCQGACIGQESSERYNLRVDAAYSEKNVAEWPYSGQIILSEQHTTQDSTAFVVDRWIIRGLIHHQPGSDPHYETYSDVFDHDAYQILRSFMLRHPGRLRIEAYNGAFEETYS